jgi:hypothetical protein
MEVQLTYAQRLTSLTLVLVIMLAAPTVAHEGQAPNVTGDWSIMFDGPQGMVRMETVFAQDDEGITGTVSGPMGSEVELAGRIEGNSIAFEFVTEMADTSIRWIFEAKVSQNEESGDMTISGTGTIESGTGSFSTPFRAVRKKD